jgi:hypothetical protein
MSIMRLESVQGGIIDSRYITSLDAVIQNLGSVSFDIIVQTLHNGHGSFMVLHHVPPFGTVEVPGIETLQTDFSLLLVTNGNTYSTIAVTLYAKLNGGLVAIFSQEDFYRVH